MPEIHDKYVNDLMRMLRPSYKAVISNLEYGEQNKFDGEVDVVAIRRNSFDLYEVKGNKSFKTMKEAIDQLRLARLHLGQEGREFLYTPKFGIEPLENIVQEWQQMRKNKRRRKNSKKRTRRRN